MNYIEIEKFKVSIDPSGNEVLTQVNVSKGVKTLKKKNWLNEISRHVFIGENAILDVDVTSSKYINGYTGYRIGVTSMKILAKVLMSGNGNTTTDESKVDSAYLLGDTPTDYAITKETGTDIRTVTFKSRFSPPTVEARIIHSLGVFKATSTRPFNNILLDVPCIQATDEVLIITYRYQYDHKSIKESIPAHEALEALGTSTIDGIVRQVGYLEQAERGYIGTPYYHGFSTCPFTKDNGIGAFPAYGMAYANTGGDVSVAKRMSYRSADEGFKFIEYGASISDFNGKFICSVHTSPQYSLRLPTNIQSDSFNSEVKLRKPLDSVVQNIYTKKLEDSGSADKPFYDLNAVGDSLGVVTVSDSFNSGDTSYEVIPHLVGLNRIEIVNGGATQTASYKVSLRYVTGFLGVDNWKMNPSSPCLRAVKNFNSTKDLTTEYVIPAGTIPHNRQITLASLIQPLELGEVLVFLPYETSHPEYGLWVQPLDLRQEYLHLTPATLPSFGATDIRGFATAEDGTIIVACANTGLWKLKRKRGDSIAATTVTRISNTGTADDTKCHAVNFVRYNHRFNSDGRIVAVFGSQLCISENGGDTWSVYDENSNPKFVHDGDYNKLLGINGAMYSEDIVVLNYSTIDLAFTTLGVNATENLFAKSVFWYKDRSDSVNSFNKSKSFYEYSEYLDTQAFWLKGGGNNICLPTLNVSVPFLVLHYQNYLSLRGYDPIADVTYSMPQLDDNYDYNTQAPVLIDDLINSTTYMINRSSSTYELRFNSLNAWLSGTTTSSDLVADIRTDIPVSVVGRGLLLGDLHEVEGTRYTSLSGNDTYLDGQAYFKNLAHIASGNDDYYKNNRFNFWYEYSYNLTSGEWELAKESDTPTAKVTHTISEPLVTGLDIKFDDNSDYVGNVLNYVAGEVFDQYVCDGILKDDYTTFEFETLNFWGDSEEGSTFSNGAVPANPVGITTEKFTVQYSNRWWDGNYSTLHNQLYFDPNYIGVYGVNSPSVECSRVFVSSLGEHLVGDFTLETQLSYTSSTSLSVSTSSSYTEMSHGAMLKLVDASSISGTSLIPTTLLGLRLQRLNGKPAVDTITLIVTDNVNGYTYIDLEAFDPKDTYKITRVGNLYTVYRNEVSLHSVSIGVPNVRWVFQIAENHETQSMAYGGYQNLLLALVNPKITYNSQTLKVKIGDPALKTGAYAPNFKYMSYIEWLHNVKALYLDGAQANVIYDMETNEPPQGAIRINIGSGELYFNSADAGKLITGDWRTTPTLNSNGE